MKFDNIAFPREFLWAALLVSLLSVWLLVGLFHQLNRYTRRGHFSIWTGAWLFYAVWMTLSLGAGDAAPGTLLFTINQFCVSISAALLLWGSMRFLGLRISPVVSSFGGMFLGAWILATPQMVNDSLQIHLPVFILLGLSSPFAGVCFLRLQKQKAFAGLGMLSLSFLLWVIYLGSYPFPHANGNLYGAGFFVAALLQVFIAISMIVLLFKEVQHDAQDVRAQIEAVRLEKEALKSKVIITKEECQSLYNRMRASEETERDLVERRRLERAAAEREQFQTFGQLAGDVAHDINNALSPITAYSELLLNSLPDLPDVPRQRLQRISAAAEDVAQIVAHMREFYRTDPAPQLSPTRAVAPKSEAGAEEKLDPDLPVGEEACRPLRILCIDDEPDLRQIMHDVLESERHQVTVAKSGKEGLELFQTALASGEPYEVVITDLGMPDLDGHSVARAIKADSPLTPIIMLTGWGAMPNASGPPGAEVDAVIGKPPRMSELSSLLYQVTARSVT